MNKLKFVSSLLLASIIFSGCSQIKYNNNVMEPKNQSLWNETLINYGENDIVLQYKNGEIEKKYYFETKERKKVKRIECFYKSGELKSELNYKKAKLNGESKEWYEGGELKRFVLFRAGNPQGEDIIYWKNGNKKSIVNYKLGHLQGSTTIYYKSGKKRAEIYFKNDKPITKEKVYFENGDLKYTSIFENGEIKEYF